MHLAEEQQSRRQTGQHTRRQRQRQPEHADAAEYPQQQREGQQHPDRTHQPAFLLRLCFGRGGKQRAACRQRVRAFGFCQFSAFRHQRQKGVVAGEIVALRQPSAQPNPRFPVIAFGEQHSVVHVPLQTALRIRLASDKTPEAQPVLFQRQRRGRGKRVDRRFRPRLKIRLRMLKQQTHLFVWQQRQPQLADVLAHLVQVGRHAAVHLLEHAAFTPQSRNLGGRLKRRFRVFAARQQNHLRVQLLFARLVRRRQKRVRLLFARQQRGQVGLQPILRGDGVNEEQGQQGGEDGVGAAVGSHHFSNGFEVCLRHFMGKSGALTIRMDNRQGKETGRLKMCLKQKTVSDFQTTCRYGGSGVFRNTFRVCKLTGFLRAPS